MAKLEGFSRRVNNFPTTRYFLPLDLGSTDCKQAHDGSQKKEYGR
jgi:hypothetical protein